MHEILNSFKWKLIPKFQQYLINLEKPQNFSKTPKPRFQNMKCMNNKRKEAYQVKKILKKTWRNLEDQDWSEMRVFGREKDRAIEREIKRNEGQIARGSLNRPSINLDRWRC